MLLGLALAGFALILAAGVGLVGAGIAVHGQATTAADAAALAAAPVTFAPFGARGTPVAEAARFAAANGGRLEWCECRIDRSFATRTVTVRVSHAVPLPGLGWVRLRATSSATFEPTALLP